MHKGPMIFMVPSDVIWFLFMISDRGSSLDLGKDELIVFSPV